MPSVLRSRGCANCLKKKKKCDEVKPICGLCRRQGLQCVDNGVKRWRFVDYEASRTTPSPRKSPSNETTMTASALVHMLEVQDIRYDIRSIGGKVLADLPAQIGSDSDLDTTVAAVVAIYNSRQSNFSRVDALSRYVDAISATRKAMEKPRQSPILVMHSLVMLFICQVCCFMGKAAAYLLRLKAKKTLIDRRNADRQILMLIYVFREAALQGTISQLDRAYIYGLLQMAVRASLSDPRIKLDSWFWDVHSSITTPRPIRYHQGASFHSVEVDTLAEFATYIRQPHDHIPRLRNIYDLVRSEKPRIRHLVAVTTAAAQAPTGALQAARLRASYLFAWALMLSVEALINNILRNVDASPEPELWVDADNCYQEMLDLAGQTHDCRPYGTAWLPDALKAVWAALSDMKDVSKIEAILEDYERDAEGCDFINEAKRLKRRLQQATKPQMSSQDLTYRSESIQGQDHIGYGDTGVSCTIL